MHFASFALLSLLALAARALALPMRRQAQSPPKLVVAHVIVGNTYGFTRDTWTADIQLAQSAGIDGFSLNVGADSWQSARVADAYAASQALGASFKLFISFDMSVLPCAGPADAAALRTYITTYAGHPAQLTVDGKVFASTFAGESCTFGQGSVPDGWRSQFTQHPALSGPSAMHFVPSFFIDPATFGSYAGVMSGAFNFNSGWPITLTEQTAAGALASVGLGAAAADVPEADALRADAALARFTNSTATDDEYRAGLAQLGGPTTYMAAVSPWFFTHYGADSLNKNFVYLADDHLFATRWENVVRTRASIDIVQLLTWNDYGESHYLKDPTPADAMPPGTTWVAGMPHAGWRDLAGYYAQAFKTGVYPAVQADALYVWARPHFRDAQASADALAKPTSAALTQDAFWAVVLARAPGTVTLGAGATAQSFAVPAGASKLSLPITPGAGMRATLSRGDATVLELAPDGFVFQGSPATYNYNAFVAYAKANSTAPSS